ncbi:MAG: alpha/beta hydrolase [Clostridia bacterium]|nr:alpha/beta hydrolase [Clostridia bacterium]MBQ7363951.1 alpha/beta hydrolase [Clostridia bacterium]
MKTIKLWDKIPLYINGEEAPVLRYFPAEVKRGTGTVIIFAGGGYMRRSAHEADSYAEFLNSAGLDTFVLDYRILPYRYPAALIDARRAVRFVRANAENFGINPGKIAVMGSSAGGHLAAHVSTFRGELEEEAHDTLDNVDPTPNAQILCYPVTDFQAHLGSYKNLLGEENLEQRDSVNPMKLADATAPRAFIWHTETDPAVKVTSTLAYAARLHEVGVRCELHVYPEGGHGLGLADKYPSVRRWQDELLFWLRNEKYIEE